MTKKFSVTWTAPTNDGGATITDYKVGITPSGGSETVTSHGGTTPPHEITGLTDGTVYGVRVRAVNSEGDGAWSSTVNQVAAFVSDAPTGLAATPITNGLDLSWTAPANNGGTPVTGYTVRYTPSGGSATTVNTGSTGTTYSLTGLTGGTSYDVEVAAINLAGTSAYSSTVTATAGSGGITPNTDNRARFYLPSGATTFSVGATTSTGYYRLTDGTVSSSVQGKSYYQGSTYWYAYTTTASITRIAGLSTVQLYSCDANGNPSGSIQAIALTGVTTPVDAVDISGLGTLTGFIAYSSSAYSGNYAQTSMNGGYSSFPSCIKEIRAVNTSFGHPYPAAPNTALNPPMVYYYSGGLEITDQDLDATALNQLYTDLGTASTANNQLVVRLNPGTASDNPSIATAKNYAVYG